MYTEMLLFCDEINTHYAWCLWFKSARYALEVRLVINHSYFPLDVEIPSEIM